MDVRGDTVNRWFVKTGLYVCMIFLVVVCRVPAFAGTPKASKPAAGDKCPVCGMFVAKYPDFAAQLVFRDGTVAYFDGVKDLLKYHRNLSRYAPGKKAADISAIYVTDFYSLGYTDGYRAYYVLGSDIYGPMGKELVPFAKKADAMEFRKDHRGRSILTFKEISDTVMRELE